MNEHLIWILTDKTLLFSEAREQTARSGTAGSNDDKSSEMIQIISMSATVGNLKELSIFLQSELYTDSWRPVQLYEYIKVRKT